MNRYKTGSKWNVLTVCSSASDRYIVVDPSSQLSFGYFNMRCELPVPLRARLRSAYCLARLKRQV
jgi:hypothetical protein